MPLNSAVEMIFNGINLLCQDLLSVSGSLTAGLTEGIPGLYPFAQAAQQVIMPIGYTILSLFFLIELFNCARKVESAGGGATMGVQMIVSVLIKLVLCKLLIDNTGTLMTAIFDVINYVTVQLSNSWGAIGTFSAAPLSIDVGLLGFLPSSGIIALLPVLLVALVVLLVLAFVWIRSRIMVYLRFIEIYIYMILAPIPLATLPGDEWGQIGKGFLKSFAAVVIQGALLFLVLAFYPVIVSSISLGLTTDASYTGVLMALLQTAFFGVLLLFALQGTSRLANRICGAMG